MKGSKGKDQDMFLHNGPVYLVVGGGDGGDLLSSSYVLFSLEKCPETAKKRQITSFDREFDVPFEITLQLFGFVY